MEILARSMYLSRIEGSGRWMVFFSFIALFVASILMPSNAIHSLTHSQVLVPKLKDRESVEIYTVKKGDSIEKIAGKHLVLPWQLRKANAFKKGVILHPGDKLKIPIINWRKKAYVGKASWYGPGFHGKPRADTKIYNQEDVLIAHRTFPLTMKTRITNLDNGKSIIVAVCDRGPYARDVKGRFTREVDLSKGAARLLGAIGPGVIRVFIEPLGVVYMC